LALHVFHLSLFFFFFFILNRRLRVAFALVVDCVVISLLIRGILIILIVLVVLIVVLILRCLLVIRGILIFGIITSRSRFDSDASRRRPRSRSTARRNN
jgi:fatty acid desaturase